MLKNEFFYSLVSQFGKLQMSIKGLLLRFFLAYLVLLLIAAGLVGFFNLESGGGFNFVALFCALSYACIGFEKKNHRYFTPKEKKLVVIGFIGIDIIVQLLLALHSIVVTDMLRSTLAMLTGAGIVGLIHGALIYFLVGTLSKTLSKKNSNGSQETPPN